MENKTNTILIIITIILIVLSTGGTHYILTNSLKDVVKESVLEIEYSKVGGKDNYDKINKIQKKQIEQYLAQQGGNNDNNKQNIPKDNNQDNIKLNGKQIDKPTLQKVKGGAYILGNPDAEISWIEYSDLECPFCRKLHESGTIERILKEYNGKVNFIFKHFPLDFHPMAQMEAEAAECVGELGGKDKYYEFIQNVFKNSVSNGRSYTKNSVSELAQSIGVDKNKVLSCIESGKYKQKTKEQMSEGATLFKVTGTPGNVLINNKNGKWESLAGAYPYEAFKQKINQLLNDK